MKKNLTKKKKIIFVTAAAAAVFYFAGFIGDNFFTNTYYNISSDKINGTVRICNISDLHNKLWGKDQHRLIEALSEISPDIILMTGDAAQSEKRADNAALFISEAKKIAPVFYSPGNHEQYEGKENFLALMKKFGDAGANVLVDESVTISLGDKNRINIIGLDNYSLHDETLHNLRESLDNDYFTIVLAHRPHYLDNYFKEDCEAVFCGHAHGGQVRLPFIGGLYAPDQGIFPKYTEGVFTENGTSVIISRGMSNPTPVPRFFNSPEIVTAEITGK